MKNPYRFQAGRDMRSEFGYPPVIPGDMSDPEKLYSADRYDSDYIWDGESMDEEKM